MIGPTPYDWPIELKRDRTPREIVAQSIDYAAWVDQLTVDKITQVFQRFSKGGNLAEAFKQHFGAELDGEMLNESHQIVIVAAELDDATERIIRYLNDRDIAINVIFFQVFQLDSEQLLSRAWLIEPTETALENASTGPGLIEGKKKRQWDELSYFTELESKIGTEQTRASRRLLQWCKTNASLVWWGQGQHNGSYIPVFEQGSSKQLLFAAYTGAPKSKPTVQLYFSYWTKYPHFETTAARLEILRRLNEIPGVRLPDSAIDKWPTIPLATLASDTALTQFISVMDWMLGETKQSIHPDNSIA